MIKSMGVIGYLGMEGPQLEDGENIGILAVYVFGMVESEHEVVTLKNVPKKTIF